MRLMRGSKFGSVRTEIDGRRFDSKAEADYYRTIKMDPNIKILDFQPKCYLTAVNILYKPDFKLYLIDKNEFIFVDVKGMETPVFKIKKRLWKHYGTYPLHLVKRSGKYFKTVEVISVGDLQR